MVFKSVVLVLFCEGIIVYLATLKMHKSLLHAHLFSNWCIGFEAIISKHQKNMSNMHSIHPFWVVLKCGHSPAKKTTACTWGFVFHKLLGGKTSYEKWTYYVKICTIWNPYFKIFFFVEGKIYVVEHFEARIIVVV